MSRLLLPASCVAVAALVLLAGAQADEPKAKAAGEAKVDLKTVPKAVRDAVKAKFPGAKLLGASTEEEGGKKLYEISLTYQDHHHDVTLEADGKVVSIEREIAFKDLPKKIAAAVKAKYPTATPKLTEELIKGDGKLYANEVLLVTADQETVEIVLDLQGKIEKEEKKGKAKAK
jgi:hypothetical protein